METPVNIQSFKIQAFTSIFCFLSTEESVGSIGGCYDCMVTWESTDPQRGRVVGFGIEPHFLPSKDLAFSDLWQKTHLTVSGNRRGLRKSLFLWPIRWPGRGANTINYLVGRIDGIFPAVHEKSPRIYPLFFFSQVISFKNNFLLFRNKTFLSS